jgi:DNA-binding transcriptional LysR family regulator
VVVRTGQLTDSNLVAKRLAPDRQIIAGSPRYFDEHGIPRRPEDLANHSCLVLGDSAHWTFRRSGREISLRVSGRLRSNNGDMLREAALDGHGIVRISELRAAGHVSDGSLWPVLTDYEVAADSAIWALYPKNKHVLPKLRVFLDFLGDWFREVRAEATLVQRAAVPKNGCDSELETILPARIRAARPIGGITRGSGSPR